VADERPTTRVAPLGHRPAGTAAAKCRIWLTLDGVENKYIGNTRMLEEEVEGSRQRGRDSLEVTSELVQRCSVKRLDESR